MSTQDMFCPIADKNLVRPPPRDLCIAYFNLCKFMISLRLSIVCFTSSLCFRYFPQAPHAPEGHGMIQLGDRDINITFKRALRALTVWDKVGP